MIVQSLLPIEPLVRLLDRHLSFALSRRDISYTTFEYGLATVKIKRAKDDVAIQETNERFDGEGGLYDQV